MERLWHVITNDSISDHGSQCRSLTTWLWVYNMTMTTFKEDGWSILSLFLPPSLSVSVCVWFQITKALVVRSHPQGRDGALKVSLGLTGYGGWYTDNPSQLFDLFGDTGLSRRAADGFSLILRDSEEILNTECCAVIRVSQKETKPVKKS